jgi:hypothetical protein
MGNARLRARRTFDGDGIDLPMLDSVFGRIMFGG